VSYSCILTTALAIAGQTIVLRGATLEVASAEARALLAATPDGRGAELRHDGRHVATFRPVRVLPTTPDQP